MRGMTPRPPGGALRAALFLIGAAVAVFFPPSRASAPAAAETQSLLITADRPVASKQLDEARTAIERVLAADPGSAAAHDRLGYVLGLQGRTEDAIAEFERAVALQPNLADAQYHLGATRWWTKQIDAARAARARRRPEAGARGVAVLPWP